MDEGGPAERFKNVRQKFGRHSAIRQEFIWVVVGMLISMVGGLVTIKILSNLLDKEEFGSYTLLFSIVSFLIAVLYTTLGQINLRYIIIARDVGQVSEFRAIQTRIFLSLLVVSAVILVPCAYWLGGLSGTRSQTYVVLLLLTFVMGYQIAQQFILMAFRKRREISLAQIAGAIARPLGVFLCITWLGQNSIVALYGLILGFSILSAVQYYYLSRQWKQFEENPNERNTNINADTNVLNPVSYLSYGFMYSLVGLVTITVLAADRWILSFSGTLEQVAIYAALMQIALAPTAFGYAVLTRLAAPIFFGLRDHPKEAQNRGLHMLLLFWAAICIPVIIVASLFHFQIVRLLTNESFAIYSYLLPWMVLGMLFERTTQILELKGAMLLRTSVYILPRILMVALIPLLEFLFLRTFGFDWLVMGLVTATGVGVVITMILNYFLR